MPPSGNRQSTPPLRSSARLRSKNRCIALGRRRFGTLITPRYQKMNRVGTNSSTSCWIMKRTGRGEIDWISSRSISDTWFDTISTGPDSGMFAPPITRRLTTVCRRSHTMIFKVQCGFRKKISRPMTTARLNTAARMESQCISYSRC